MAAALGRYCSANSSHPISQELSTPTTGFKYGRHGLTADRRYSFSRAVADAGVNATALGVTCPRHIARFKRPKQYRCVDALPKKHYGKVLTTTLREQRTAGEKTW
jgi:acyl-CoA synthetase (AMP-forming)/AMP-acid ligase II